MVRGLYTAYTGMRNEQRRLDIISNNLANSATIGYKEENVTSRSFKDMMAVKIRDGSVGYVDQNIGTMNLGVKIGETYMDWSQGNLRETGNTYDLAIQGDGFFTIRVTDKQGKDEMMYTRCSTFKCTQDGYTSEKPFECTPEEASAITASPSLTVFFCSILALSTIPVQ